MDVKIDGVSNATVTWIMYGIIVVAFVVLLLMIAAMLRDRKDKRNGR
jgi:type VI protein secretion system component VasF